MNGWNTRKVTFLSEVQRVLEFPAIHIEGKQLILDQQVQLAALRVGFDALSLQRRLQVRGAHTLLKEMLENRRHIDVTQHTRISIIDQCDTCTF
ncbi:hypothetical protein D3C84_913470 [compost metagenome]